jgi:hypothetical protein
VIRILEIGGDGALGYGDEVLIKWVEIYGIGVFIQGDWNISSVWGCVVAAGLVVDDFGNGGSSFFPSFFALKGLITVLAFNVD